MLIEVTKVGEALVEFTCAVGHGRAAWQGAPPAVGDRRQVELETDALGGGVEIAHTASRRPEIRASSDAVEITAKLVDMYADGTAWFAFADGRLLIETGGGPRFVVGDWYVVVVAELRVYDTNL